MRSLLGKLVTNTARNTVISPNFLLWKFCEKAQFPHSFGRFAQNYTETVAFHKISARGNLGEITVFFAVELNDCYSPFVFQDILVMNSNGDPKEVSKVV